MEPLVLLVFVGVITMLGVGGVIYVAFGRRFEIEERRQRRMSSLGVAPGGKKNTGQMTARQKIQAQSQNKLAQRLKELEEQKKQSKSLNMKARLIQAGSQLQPAQFMMIFYVIALIAGLGALAYFQSVLYAGCVMVICAFGLPRFWLSQMIKGRQKKFVYSFANAIDVLVRGVRSGLPVNEGLKLIATEMPEPVKGEFRRMVDATSVGVSLEDALGKMFERMPLNEVNFFRTVLVIQKQTGGNLAEALDNLSGILRDRKKLKGKIKALSSEARMSAMIIGSLPFVVGGLVYLVTPDYIMTLYYDPMGNMMVGGGLVWMSFGVLMMRSMTNFEI